MTYPHPTSEQEPGSKVIVHRITPAEAQRLVHNPDAVGDLLEKLFPSSKTIHQVYANHRQKSAIGFRGGRFSTEHEILRAKFLNSDTFPDGLIALITKNYELGGLEYPQSDGGISSAFVEIVDDDSNMYPHERSLGFALGSMTPTNFQSEAGIKPQDGDVAFLAFYRAKDDDGNELIEVDPQNFKRKRPIDRKSWKDVFEGAILFDIRDEFN